MRNLYWIVTLFLGLMLLAACGGSATEEPAAVNEEPAAVAEEEETVVEEEEAVEEPMEEPTEVPVEEPTEASAETEEEMEEPTEEPMEEPTEAPVEEAAPAGFGDLPLSGTDPETGLEINPDMINPGDTFIARGIVISMNLTPVTEPEFLIQAPSGTKYRMRTQALADMFFDDGTQWKPHEFRQGVGATATVTLDASASLSDVSNTEDLILIIVEE
ncbi:MAG: hypothetical protein DWQ04_19035 [Chloroflexi bacterium]|nr:MAG: hypothetical protein DWQ04_19035 [Chloroflexota bacterium]